MLHGMTFAFILHFRSVDQWGLARSAQTHSRYIGKVVFPYLIMITSHVNNNHSQRKPAGFS